MTTIYVVPVLRSLEENTAAVFGAVDVALIPICHVPGVVPWRVDTRPTSAVVLVLGKNPAK
jgi:hypothetical protein